MQRIRSKGSRQAYRKAIKQIKSPTYLQQLLTKQDNTNPQKFQKYFNVPLTIVNPQKQQDQQIQKYNQNVSRMRLSNSQMLQIKIKDNKNIKNDNKYYQQFLTINRNKNIGDKVQRERINTQTLTYQSIFKKFFIDQKLLLTQLVQYSKDLQQKYNKCRQLIQKLPKTISYSTRLTPAQQQQKSKIQKLKLQQQHIQQKIKQKTLQFITNLKNRNNFIAILLKNGHYQQNGLICFLKEYIQLQKQDQNNKNKLYNSGQAGRQIAQFYEIKGIKLELKEEDMPDILDAKSKQYLKFLHQNMKEQEQNQVRNRTITQNRRMTTNQHKYIQDSQFNTFPYSQLQKQPKLQKTHSKSFSKNKSNAYMYCNSNDKVMKMYKIKDMFSSEVIQPHIYTQSQKYNHDIKNIYANTREALTKWVQGKCKVIANSRYQESQQSILNSKQLILEKQYQSFNKSRQKAQKQNSLMLSQTLQKMQQYTNGSIKPTQIRKNQVIRIQRDNKKFQMRNQSFSLPLVQNKPDKSTSLKQSLQNQQKSRIDTSTIMKSKQKQIQNQQNDLIQMPKNRNKVQFTLKQQIRVMRIYPKQKQQIVLKYLFGIEIKRQNLLQLQYY